MDNNVNKLVVGALGHSNAGKSKTWYTLFGRKLRTGWHWLPLSETEQLRVFVVNGSAEERHRRIENIIGEAMPTIVLCSFGYRRGVENTIQFFSNHSSYFYVHWLNPGCRDRRRYNDVLGLVPLMEDSLGGGEVHKRDGQIDPTTRVEEMRSFVRE